MNSRSPIQITAYDLAMRFVGTKEVAGTQSNPAILAMLKLDGSWPPDDSTPWCSAFVNYIAWLLRLPRSKSLAARSWLGVGAPIRLEDAELGFDVVVLERGPVPQPGPEVIQAPGHVGFYGGLVAGSPGRKVMVLGGNQGDQVSLAPFDSSRILGIRRL